MNYEAVGILSRKDILMYFQPVKSGKKIDDMRNQHLFILCVWQCSNLLSVLGTASDIMGLLLSIIKASSVCKESRG